MDDDLVARLMASTDLNNWPVQFRKLYEDVYEAEEFEAIWVDHMKWYDVDRPQVPAEILNKIKCPVLMCHGDNDSLVTLEHAQLLAQNLPNCRMELFPNAAHNLHQQYPEKIKIVAENFLMDF